MKVYKIKNIKTGLYATKTYNSFPKFTKIGKVWSYNAIKLHLRQKVGYNAEEKRYTYVYELYKDCIIEEYILHQPNTVRIKNIINNEQE